jgi:hypothetical protein
MFVGLLLEPMFKTRARVASLLNKNTPVDPDLGTLLNFEDSGESGEAEHRSDPPLVF